MRELGFKMVCSAVSQTRRETEAKRMAPPALLSVEGSPLLLHTFYSPKQSPSAGSDHDNHDNLSESLSVRRRELLSSLRSLSSKLSNLIDHHTGSIGYLGSTSICVNSLTGPAMLQLPATFARSGIVPTIATLLLVCFLASLSSLHMANTISKVPGNSDFKREVEYSDAFQFFWGRRWFVVTEALFFCCITCLNISSIVDTAHVVDTILGHWFPWGGTVALQLNQDGVDLLYWDYSECSNSDFTHGLCIPFNDADGGLLLTAGAIITTVVFLPLALLDLKDNVASQVLCFLVLLITCIQFVVQFSLSPELDFGRLSWWGDDWDDLLGVILFNFAMLLVVPTWLYERERQVDVPTVIHGSMGLSAALYIAIGILGHAAIPHISDNMLESMMTGLAGRSLQLGASVFAFFIVGLGIPLFSVLTRMNLTGSGLCSHGVGDLMAVYLPFGASLFLYDGTTITKLLSWGGMIFTSLVAFILPLILTLHVVRESDGSMGTILVYGGWLESSRSGQLRMLTVLLGLSIAAVIAAIAGNFLGTQHRVADEP